MASIFPTTPGTPSAVSSQIEDNRRRHRYSSYSHSHQRRGGSLAPDRPHDLDTPALIVRDLTADFSSLPLSLISSADANGQSKRSFMEDVLQAVHTTRPAPDRYDDPYDLSPPSQIHPSKRASLPANAGAAIDPSSIPTRTSSSNAVNGDRYPTSPKSPKSPPRKHKSLAYFPDPKKLPEVSETDWIAAARLSRSNPSHSRYDTDAPQSLGAFPMAAQESKASLGDAGPDLIEEQSLSWSLEKENILKGPFDYLESHPGKDIRSELIGSFDVWLQVPPASLQIITKVVGMLHTASLLIDDVEDSSVLRRGVPVAHSIFGTAQTINSANYIYFCALQELFRLNNPEAIRIYTEELLNLHRGQGMDLFWRDTLTCPSEDDYLEMVGNKTGGLFRLAIKLMCAESPSHNSMSTSPSSSSPRQADYVPLVNTVGLLYQILDDYRNLSDTIYTANKGLCEDLTEGKFSFPIIHAIRSDPSNLVLINILKQKTQDDEVKKYAVAYMERAGSFAYCRRVLRGLTKKALALVDEVDGGRGKGDGIRNILERLRVDKDKKGASSSVS